MGYWIASLGLIAFGFLGALSIGRPFFLVGLAMLVLGPVRRHPALFWPPLLAVVAYNVGYWAVAPLYCTATGLLTAIPALAFFYFFKNRANRIILSMEALTLDSIKSLRNVEVVTE